MPDRKKVINGLEHCSKGPIGCQTNCPYQRDFGCRAQLASDALELLKEDRLEIASEVVKESILMYQGKQIVRCKECKYGEKQNNAKGEPMIECVLMYDDAWLKDPDWFCADGKYKDGELLE